MPSSNRYPKSNPVSAGGSRPQTYPRRPLAPYRPTRPWTPPVRKPAVFPGMPRPVGPFGKRLPIPGVIPPVVPRVAFPWVRVFARLNPWLFAALTLYDLWQIYQQWNPPTGGVSGNCGRILKPTHNQFWRFYPDVSNRCFADAVPSVERTWAPTRPLLRHTQARNFPTHSQHETLEWWIITNPDQVPPEMPVKGYPEPVPDFVLPPQPMLPPMPWFPIAVPPLAPMPPPVPRPPFIPMLPNPEAVTAPRGNHAPGQEPGSRPRPQARLRPRPPGRGTKERKLKGTAQQRKFLGWLLSSASEANDLLDALHDALPKEFQGRDHPASKWEALYKNWDKVDMSEAFTNIWNNQATDKYYGEAFKKLQEGLSEAGFDFPSPRDIGGQFGLSGLR